MAKFIAKLHRYVSSKNKPPKINSIPPKKYFTESIQKKIHALSKTSEPSAEITRSLETQETYRDAIRRVYRKTRK